MAINFLNSIDFNQIESLHIRIENQANDTNAGTSVDGQLYYNTSNDVLKVSDGSGGWKEVGGGVETLTAAQGTFISFTAASSATGDVDLGTFDLSAGGSPSATTFLRGDNTWAATGTVTSVGLSMPSAFSVSNSPVTSSGTLTVTGAGSTAQYIDGTGALQTFPTLDNYQYWVLSDGTTSTNITSTATATFQGTANEIEVGESSGTITIGLPDDVTIAGELTVNGTGQSSFGGQVTIPTTPTAGTDAASKAYVDSLVSGGLTFIDGFNAGSGAIDGGGNLTTGASRVAVSIGDYYVVTTAGSFYGSVALDVGDSVIAKLDAAQGTSDINDWVIVQGDEGVTTFSNSNGGTYVSYGTTNSGAIGAVNIGDVDLTAVDGTSDTSTKFLSKDNTWDVPSYTTNTDANYALTAEAKSGSNVPLTLTGSSGGATTTVNLTEGANITLTRNSSGQITIASTDTGALGKKIVLNSSLSYVGKADSGGVRTFAINVANSNVFGSGSTAKNVKCEVINASTSGATAGQTVYADITRGVNAGGETYGTASLNIAIVGTPADSAYEVLLTYVG